MGIMLTIIEIAGGITLAAIVLSIIGFKLVSSDWFVDWSINIAYKLTEKTMDLEIKLLEKEDNKN